MSPGRDTVGPHHAAVNPPAFHLTNPPFANAGRPGPHQFHVIGCAKLRIAAAITPTHPIIPPHKATQRSQVVRWLVGASGMGTVYLGSVRYQDTRSSALASARALKATPRGKRGSTKGHRTDGDRHPTCRMGRMW